MPLRFSPASPRQLPLTGKHQVTLALQHPILGRVRNRGLDLLMEIARLLAQEAATEAWRQAAGRDATPAPSEQQPD